MLSMAEHKSDLHTTDTNFIAAIDFGSAYSGYAFAIIPHNTEIKDVKIYSNQAWNSGNKEAVSLKTPTALLLNKDKEIISFGFEAENDYSDFILDGVQDDYYFFHRFKMDLYNSKSITSDMILEDACGKSMYAVEVFAFSIKALKTHLEEHLERNNIYTNPERTKWILTVPAIWSDAAKQFMRKSGEMAGIPNSKLHIALESEVASVYCQCFPPVGGVDIAAIGSKYIVADLGGGTVDITAHETLPNQKLKELTKASGNNCGGNMIENHFMEVIFGSEFLSVFRKRYPDSFIYLLRCFESMKRIVQSSKSAFVTVTIPYTILNSFCISERGVGLHEFISSKFNSEIAKVFKDKIRIHLDYAKDQFEKICKEIVLLINELFRRDEFNNFRHILLVGGFAKCRLVHECLQNAFPQLSVIVPEDPDLAVLKGSVLFGYKPDIISYRIIRYSYGVLSTPLFDEKVHDSKRKIVCDGHARCNNVFKSFMEAGTLVRRNTVIKRSYRTRQRFQENLWIQVFYAERGNVQYTDGDHCQKLGEIVVHLLKPSEQGQLVDVVFHFGETELTVEAGDPESNTRYSVLLKIHEFKQ